VRIKKEDRKRVCDGKDKGVGWQKIRTGQMAKNEEDGARQWQ